jgi:hypothetical protein
VAAGVASSAAVKSPETGQAGLWGGLRSPELTRTGEGGQRTRWRGSDCDNMTGDE